MRTDERQFRRYVFAFTPAFGRAVQVSGHNSTGGLKAAPSVLASCISPDWETSCSNNSTKNLWQIFLTPTPNYSPGSIITSST